jgi:hypothetical protein
MAKDKILYDELGQHIRVGDIVTPIKHSLTGLPYKVIDIHERTNSLTVIGGSGAKFGWYAFNVRKIKGSKLKRKEEQKMMKCITNVYEKTKDAILVEEYLGSCIQDTFFYEVVLRAHKEEFLEEAKRREAAAKQRRE